MDDNVVCTLCLGFRGRTHPYITFPVIVFGCMLAMLHIGSSRWAGRQPSLPSSRCRHVADAYTKRYSSWASKHLSGLPGTEGRPDPVMYNYATSARAQEPNMLEALGYNLTGVIQAWKRETGFVAP